MNFKTKITKIHYDKNAKGIFFKILEFCSLFYGIGSGLKNLLYDRGILKPKKVDAFVISVGNVTTGGVGKTPVVAKIAKYYISNGEKVAIISRGYGGALSNKQINVISDGNEIFCNARLAGDEPFWLAENVNGAIVITSKNRTEAAEYAIQKYGTTKIILDDGFQHRKLYRNLDIVLVDSDKMYGNGHLLPAGPLREGKEAFKRIFHYLRVFINGVLNQIFVFRYYTEDFKPVFFQILVDFTVLFVIYVVQHKRHLPACRIFCRELFYSLRKKYGFFRWSCDNQGYVHRNIDELMKIF